MPTPEGSARAKVRRHRMLVIVLRVLFAVVLLGSWEILSRTKTIDPFFFGRPSEIGQKIWSWATVGSPDGSLWADIWITVQEALLGFGIGVLAGVIFGLALGRIRLLSDVLGPYIKAANSIPRVVLGSIHGLGHLIAFAQGTFDTNGVFAAMTILAVIALAAEFLITTLENRLITWRPDRRDAVAL